MTYQEPTIPCHVCGRPTKMLGTKKCDYCWNALGNINAINADAVIKDAIETLGLEDTDAAKALLAVAEPIAQANREREARERRS